MRVLGHLGMVTPRVIRGWALIEGQAEPVDVRIQINGIDYAVVRADLPRPDVMQRGLHPTGRCGFALEIPEAEALKASDLVSARVVGADKDIASSPMLCKIPPGASLIDEPVVPAGPGAGAALALPEKPMFLPGSAVRSSWQIFRDSLFAFFLREVKNRFGSERFGYFWAIAEPILYVLILQSARYLMGRGRLGDEIDGVDGLYFFALGVLVYFVFQRSYHQCLGSMGAFKGLFSYRQLKPIDIVFVRCTIESGLMFIVLVALSYGLYWAGMEVQMEHPAEFLCSLSLLFVFAIGVGLTADVYITGHRELQKVFSLLERPLLFLSGMFFSMRDVSEEMLKYLYWNPIFHAIDLGRGAALEQYDSPGSWLFLGACSFGALFIGLAAYRRNMYTLTQQ